MSRSLRSAMTMIFRRSEEWKERASRLHDVEEVLDIVQRVELGHPSQAASCLWRALGHTIKQGSSQSAMIGVARFEGLAPRTERRPFCERRALASPDAHHAVGSCADLLGALRGGTCQARALHAIRAGP